MQEEKENSLAQELSFFDEKKAELLKHYRGQFALIKGRELFGMFTSGRRRMRRGESLWKCTDADQADRVIGRTGTNSGPDAR